MTVTVHMREFELFNKTGSMQFRLRKNGENIGRIGLTTKGIAWYLPERENPETFVKWKDFIKLMKGLP